MIQSKGSLLKMLDSLDIKKSKLVFAYKLKNESVGDNCIALSRGTPQITIDRIKKSLSEINSINPLLDINN
jgi:polar amino acid transport system substrate-binding protein